MDKIAAELQANGFQIIEKIGQGGFGQVFKVRWLQYPEKYYAAKIISKESGEEKAHSTFGAEVESLQALDHRNIINIYKFFESDTSYYIILEFCQHGNLKSYIQNKGRLGAHDFLKIAHDCLQAVHDMHKKGIVHLDIKPENIFFDENYRIKVADFGLACFNASTKIKVLKGSSMYMSPERFTGGMFDPYKADIWGLGVTFYYLLNAEVPWDTTNQKTLMTSIAAKGITFKFRTKKSIERLIDSMLDKDPQYRPDSDKLLKNQIFKNSHTSISCSNILTDNMKIIKTTSLVLSKGHIEQQPFKTVQQSMTLRPVIRRPRISSLSISLSQRADTFKI